MHYMKYLTQKTFWKTFFRFFSVGVSVLFILAFISSVSFAEIAQRGPKTALAIGECEDGYRNFGGGVWYPDSTCDENSYQSPGQAPAQVPGQAPQPLQPSQPQCIPNPREYNECAGPDKPGLSYRIWTDDCGNFERRGAQADAACGPILQPVPEPVYQPQPAPQPAPQPQPVYQPQPAPQPQPQPVAQPVAPICIPQNVSMSVNPNPATSGQQINLNVSGSEGSTWIDDKIVDQYGNTVYSGGFWGGKTVGPLNPGNYTWTHYYRNTAPNNFNITSDLCQKSVTLSVSQPAPQPSPTPIPTPVPTPAPRGAVDLRCPDGTVQTLEGNTIVCIQNINNNVNNINNQNSQSQSQVVNVPPAQIITVPQNVQTVQREVLVPATTAAAPKVTYVAATEAQALPKTGLPLAGVALGGLLPIGLRLRKIGKGKDIISANSLWEERQFKI